MWHDRCQDAVDVCHFLHAYMKWNSLNLWQKAALVFPLCLFAGLILYFSYLLFDSWPEVYRDGLYYCPAKSSPWVVCDFWKVVEHWIVGPFFIVVMLPALFLLSPFDLMSGAQEFSSFHWVVICGIGTTAYAVLGAVLGYVVSGIMRLIRKN